MRLRPDRLAVTGPAVTGPAAGPGEHHLRLTEVGHSYGGLTALHAITLHLPAGARHAIIGPNGSGKTTLLNIVAGTVRPTSGRVHLDGHDITRLRPATRARQGVGRTWQHPAVFPRLTAADNIRLASIRPTRLRPAAGRQATTVGDVLDRAGRAVASRTRDVLDRVGLNQHASTRAADLPYGLQRLLEIAVVLAAQPRLLLLDEPSAGLDPTELHRLTTLIDNLPTDVTVLLADHHLPLVFNIADTVTVLHQGHPLATGPPAQIRADPAVQAAYLTPHTTTPRPRRATTPTGPLLLRLRGLAASYHGGATILTDLNLDIADGETVAVLGRNGAGKTTLTNVIAGLHTPHPSTLIELAGDRLPAGRARHAARAGVAVVPQGRRLFHGLTVAEHLTIAVTTARQTATGPRWRSDDILQLLPALAHRLWHQVAHLSGGEQQMLALARAMLANPRLLILDAPTEGLAPAVITILTTAIRAATAAGVGVLITDQHLPPALAIADRIVVLHHGRVALNRPVTAFTDNRLRHQVSQLLGLSDT